VTPDQLAALHAAAFRVDRPWSAEEFASLLDNRFSLLIPHPHGFALIRTILDESELLTLAVDPLYRRQGIALSLLESWLYSLETLHSRAFLEVAADNVGAIALYHRFGFTTRSTRTAYYTRQTSDPVDALLMERAVTRSQMAK
jgi:ribosomal-protein-alanine N-acetyltransferase